MHSFLSELLFLGGLPEPVLFDVLLGLLCFGAFPWVVFPLHCFFACPGLVLFFFSVLISCGATDNSDTVNQAATSGRVSLLITDGPTLEFDQINVTLESISFIGEDDGHDGVEEQEGLLGAGVVGDGAKDGGGDGDDEHGDAEGADGLT